MDSVIMPHHQRRPFQLHVLAYNLGNFMRTLAMPKAVEPWSPTSLREKLIRLAQRSSAKAVT
jgi:hypothetical protein